MRHSLGSILLRIRCFLQIPIFAFFFRRASREPPERIGELNLRDG